MKKKAWSGRFKEKTDKLVEEMNASIGFDKRLFRHDILGSIAHAQVLVRAGILKEAEARKIIKGLKEVEKEIEAGKLKLTADLEDIHMAVESRLTEKIGPPGGKLHTGRSRNDQGARDLRLYLRGEIFLLGNILRELKASIVEKAGDNIDCVMPGYTHLQRAQPVLFAH